MRWGRFMGQAAHPIMEERLGNNTNNICVYAELKPTMNIQRAFALSLVAGLWLTGVGTQAGEVLVENNRFDCVIEPSEIVNLGSSADGVLVEVSVKRGDRVTEGQLVARIDSRVQEATVALARVRAESNAGLEASRARLDFRRAKLKRNRKLAAQKVISAEELEELETQLVLAEISYQQAQVDKRMEKLELERALNSLALRQIRSPFDGLVMEKVLDTGEYVDGTVEILRIARLDPLKVQADLPAALFAGITPGMAAEVYPKEAVGGFHNATVSVRDQVLDSKNSTFHVRLELANPNYDLPAGVGCHVRFLP